MDQQTWKARWEAEEAAAHMHGWDFSHLEGRYDEERDLPWDYDAMVRSHLRPESKLMDYDTGGGEYLLSLGHPYGNTAATEGYPPNVALCRERLLPLGIDFRPCSDPARLPFDSGAFDLLINRHGDYDLQECYRVLRPGGVWITEQVGAENDRDLVEMVLPGLEKPFPHHTLAEQCQAAKAAGFQLEQAGEAFCPILFYDVGAFVWFARVLPWEFPGFSVERCFDRLLRMQERLEQEGSIRGTIHRFFLVGRKPGG